DGGLRALLSAGQELRGFGGGAGRGGALRGQRNAEERGGVRAVAREPGEERAGLVDEPPGEAGLGVGGGVDEGAADFDGAIGGGFAFADREGAVGGAAFGGGEVTGVEGRDLGAQGRDGDGGDDGRGERRCRAGAHWATSSSSVRTR